jgi:TRAP-type C4-dicarboxylate transport system permease small subunit
MNEIILILLSIVILFTISLVINKLKTPFQSYVRICSSLLLVLFAWLMIPTGSNWLKIMLSSLVISIIIKEKKKLQLRKENIN